MNESTSRHNCSGCQVAAQAETWTPGQRQVWCRLHGAQNHEDGDIAIVRDFTGQRYLLDTLDGDMAPIGG